ncbi:MAG: FAD-binding oxidoreductase [Devosiaceae bacterium]|nr:FAD-binding oxidoreductase [Devosiaceae bacterium MH13]
MAIHPSITILGAGIVGATIAYTLARAGHRVRMIEQAQPGEGVTALSSGWVNWITADPTDDPARYASLQAAFPRYQALDEAFAGQLIGRREGALRWLPEQGQTEAMIEAHKQAGSDVEAVSGVRLRSLAPALAEMPPLAAYAADDFLLDARSAAVLLLDAAKSMGAEVHTDVSAVSLDLRGETVTGVIADDSTHAADLVVLAVGGATGEVLAPLGLPDPVRKSPAAIIRFSTEQAPAMPIIAAPDVEVHVRSPSTITMAKSVRGEMADNPAAATDLGALAHQQLAQAMPSLRALKLVGSRIGQRPVPTQGKPLVGPVGGVKGLLVAVAHPGVILAPEMAETIAAMVPEHAG